MDSARTAKRAHRLAHLLMQEMHAALRDRGRLSSDEWEKLFGAKQSMVANLQKLVSTLAALPQVEGRAVKKAKGQTGIDITEAEFALLKAWLEEGGA